MEKHKFIIRSNRSTIKEFKKSLLAKDIRRELLVWKRLCLNDYYEASNMLEKGKVDGRIEVIDRILNMPDVMIQELDREKENEDGS